MNRAITILSLLAWLLATISLAQAQSVGTSFTLQGKLENSGQFANGNYDFIVDVFDASTGGNLLNSQVFNGVNVEQGEFSLNVDVGSFDGTQRWLEITINEVATGNTTLLSPRTPVQAAPVAQFALNADPQSVQKRVTGSCGTGQAMTAINEDGSVACASVGTPATPNRVTVDPDGNGDYTELSAAIGDSANWCDGSSLTCVVQLSAGRHDLANSMQIQSFPSGLSSVIIRGMSRESTRLVIDNNITGPIFNNGAINLVLEDMTIFWNAVNETTRLIDSTSGNITLRRFYLGHSLLQMSTTLGGAAISTTGGSVTLDHSEYQSLLYMGDFSGTANLAFISSTGGQVTLNNSRFTILNGSRASGILYHATVMAINGAAAEVNRSQFRFQDAGVPDTYYTLFIPVGSNNSKIEINYSRMLNESKGPGLYGTNSNVTIRSSHLYVGKGDVLLVETPNDQVITLVRQSTLETDSGNASIELLGTAATLQSVRITNSELEPGGSGSAVSSSTGYTTICVANVSINSFYANTCP